LPNSAIHGTLQGRENSTPNLDMRGHTLAFILSELPLAVPVDRVQKFTQSKHRF
jgi:hypothetical protein